MRKDRIEPLVALGLLVLAMPLLALIAAAVKCSSPGPVFFRRQVIGKGGRIFGALKFRTMVQDADQVLSEDASLRQAFEVSYKLQSDPRVTRVGRLLRKYSLDELPQLANVVRGEMALVGPRMISPDELPRYGALGERLLSVKPGLTGLWQVSGRQTLSFARRLELDMYYVEHQSLRLDLAILLRTPLTVLKAEGAY
jgi:lipopolysaccharide/colanic/teichoic acid biosynthesis glycosyltransferase